MTDQRARANDTPLPGFDSRNPTRQDFQNAAGRIADCLEVVELALESDVASTKAAVAIQVIRQQANCLCNALDSIYATEGSDVK